MGPHHGTVEHLYEMRRLAGLSQQLKKRLEHTRPTQPPEALPNAVPLTEFTRQGPPCDAVNREIVQRLQELTIIMAGFPAV